MHNHLSGLIFGNPRATAYNRTTKDKDLLSLKRDCKYNSGICNNPLTSITEGILWLSPVFCNNSYITCCSFLDVVCFLRRLSQKGHSELWSSLLSVLEHVRTGTWVVVGIYGTNVAPSSKNNRKSRLQPVSSAG